MTSGGNSFNDFPENQITIDFAFLLQAYLGERYCITVSPCPDIICGNSILPKNIWRNNIPVFLLDYITAYGLFHPAHALVHSNLV